MPTDQDIFNLKTGKLSTADFDAKYGANAHKVYISQPETQAQPTEPQAESRITEIPEQIAGGIVDATVNTAKAIGGLSEIANEKFSLDDLSASIREKALEQGINIPVVTIDDGQFNIRSGQEAIDYIRAKKDDPNAKTGLTKLADVYSKNVDEAKEFYSIDEPEYLHGSMIKGVSQFLTGFVGGKRLLDGAGWATKKLTKEQTKSQLLKNTANNFAKTMTASAIADAVVFDEHMPRLSDMALEFGFDNALTKYLASDPNDTFAEGRFKNALEGFLIGLPLEGLFSSFRYLKLRKARSEGKKVSQKQIDEDEKFIEQTEQELADNLDAISKGEDPTNVTRVDEVKTKLDPKVQVDNVNVSKEGLKEKFADQNLGYGKEGINTLLKNIESYRKGELELDETLDIGINGKNLNDLPEHHIIISDVIQNLKTQKSDAFDAVETHAIVQKRAELLMQDPMKAMASMNKLAKNIDGASKYIVAGLSLAQSYANALPKIARLIEASKNPANGVSTTWTEKDFDKVVDVLATLLLDEKIIERNVGRMLNAKNITVTQADVSIEKVAKEIELVKSYGGDKQKFMRKIAYVDNPHAIMRVMNWVFGNKTWNVANEIWINSILSSPSTHIVNMTSNLIMGLLRPVEQYVGAKAMKLLTREKYFDNVADEALDIYAGMMMYMNDARKMAGKAFLNSEGILDGKVGKVEGVEEATGKSIFGKIIRFPTRALNASDELFKGINYRGKLYSIAVREARNLGKSTVKDKTFGGKPISDFELHVMKRFEDGFVDKVIAKDKEALEYARTNTFTDELNPNSTGGFLQRQATNFPAFRQLMPFIRTPLNIASNVIRRVPGLNGFSKRFKNEMFGNNPVKQAEALGGMIVGMSFIGTAIGLVKAGMITGGGYEDYKLKEQQKRAKFKPYSFKFGDVYIPYGRLDPFGMFFGLVADFVSLQDQMSEKEQAEFAHYTLMSTISNMTMGTAALGLKTFTNNIASKTYLELVSNAMDALFDSNPDSLKKVLREKVASMVVPNIVSKFKFDKTMRETRTVGDEIMNRLPFFSKFVEPKYNWLGEPDIRQGNFWSDAVMPMLPERMKEDKLHAVLSNLKNPIMPVPEIYNGVNLTQYKIGRDSAYRLWNEALAKTDLRKELEELVNDPNFDTDYTDNLQFDRNNKFKGTKIVEIMNIINEYREEAFDEIAELEFTSPTGEKIILLDEIDKMRDNKLEYKRGAIPSELEGLL
jgi:hypothetical protein